MRTVTLLSVILAASLTARPAPAQNDGQTTLPTIGIAKDPGAWYQTHVEHLSPYQDSLVFRVYFLGSMDTALVRVGTNTEGSPVQEEVGIARPLPPRRAADSAGVVLLRCIDQVCRPARREITYDDYNLRVAVRERVSGKETFRLTAPSGAVRLVRSHSDTTDSPAIDRLMPRTFDESNTLLGGPPLIRFNLAPLARALASGEGDGSALRFEGGFHQYRRRSRTGISYHGDLGTDTLVTFDRLRVDGEWEFNLRPTSFLPLRISAGGESDASFDVTNLIGGVALRGIIGIPLNFSPRGEGYIPNVGPQWEVGFESGVNVRDDHGDHPSRFSRSTYGVQWMIPLAANTVARIEHSGVWQHGNGFVGASEYHPTWDTGIELRMGGVTYFLGHRRGEAAPLFREVKTVAAGIVIGVREPR